MVEHPLRTFARERDMTLAQIAGAARTSRMTLHRVINGENTTVDLLRRVSEATGGAVTVEQLVNPPEAKAKHNSEATGRPAPVDANAA